MLVGGTRERARLERLLEEARAGRSTALLLHGDPATPGDRFTAPAGLLSLAGVLVARGMTNREAAAALFLSPKTIEYHLGQIDRKLDVRGRSQLVRLMAMELPEGERDPAVLADALG
jgi:ATP/maltotriose-dependent transcriptional regulator MalT